MTDDALPELRASDADRERTAELLRRAAGEGRLTIDELDERLDLVYATRTQRELDKLTADVVVLDDPARANRMPVRTGEGSNWVVSVMSGHDRKGRWRVGRHLKVISVMGGSSIDLNDAELTSDVTEITVFSIMGGSDVRVPDGLNVEISDFAFMGGNDAKIGEYMPESRRAAREDPDDLDRAAAARFSAAASSAAPSARRSNTHRIRAFQRTRH